LKQFTSQINTARYLCAQSSYCSYVP